MPASSVLNAHVAKHVVEIKDRHVKRLRHLRRRQRILGRFIQHAQACADDLANRNLVRMRTHVSYSLKGKKKVKIYMTWTLDGVRFLNSKLGYPNF